MNKLLMLLLTWFFICPSGTARAESWVDVLAKAKGQTVYWKAWAGSEATNAYIGWTAREVDRRYGITLRHVKITNPSELVSGTLAEKTAGRDENGATDLLWINGENFLAMKEHGLLFGPFTRRLPNFARYVNPENPAYTHDFTVPVEGLEAPWGLAQVVFIYDTSRDAVAPSLHGRVAGLRKVPSRKDYPPPGPLFYGVDFSQTGAVRIGG